MAQDDQNTGLQLQIPGMDQFKDLKFIQSETNPADLVVQLPDGSEVVFPNYLPLAQAGAPPAITLEDGTVVPGQEIVSLIEDLDYDLIAPAAGGDTVGPVTGGGAGFLSDPSGPLGDDIGHGPYAGGIQIADAVEFEQLLGDTDPDGSSGGGGDLPEMAIRDNDGDYFGFTDTSGMDAKTVFTGTSGDTYNRPVDPGDFRIILETEAPSGNDWDGIRIELREGESITITPDQSYIGQYHIGLDVDGSQFGGATPVPTPYLISWDYTTFEGSISYTASSDGYVYVGTGFEGGVAPQASYFTQIDIDNDNELLGSSGNDILIGGSGDEVLIGGAGDDQLTGGAGSDQFRFESTADGHDIVNDFLAGAGNDVVNLDALFDSLSVASADRIGRVDIDPAGVLRVEDAGGTAYSGFSVDLGASYDENTLLADGNLVVDES